MSLVLRNMPLYRFRYVDVTGRERFAVLRRGQSVDHLNISDETLNLLKRLVVGVKGEPHPVFVESAPAVATKATAPVTTEPVAEPASALAAEVAFEEIVEAPVAAAKPAAKKSAPKAKAKKPTVNS